MPETDRSALWAASIHRMGERIGGSRGLVVEGKLTRMVGLTLEAVGCRAAIGGRCDVVNAAGAAVEAEVVGFAGESLYLMPTGDIRGLEPDARVVPTGRVSEANVGDELLGRIIDGSGRPLDGGGGREGRGAQDQQTQCEPSTRHEVSPWIIRNKKYGKDAFDP